jgi:hypothetical protein
VHDHLLHDERIADEETHDLRNAGAGGLAKDFAHVEARHFHEARRSRDAVHDAFQVGVRLRCGDTAGERSHVRVTHCFFESGHHALEGLGRNHGESLDIDPFGSHGWLSSANSVRT